ncbi:hypothetical protein MVEN_01052000 [Mycena venus]|uniref:F-box domain-containing protein n=1 Tax=Mycena venus TaxID=2733690 RepID=A0A8H6Y7L5_9AGAR|nr:hypothetical protein MVEN_01052000 [Mycena venus]
MRMLDRGIIQDASTSHNTSACLLSFSSLMEVSEIEFAMPCADCNKTHTPRAALAPSPFQSIIAQARMPDVWETAAIRDFSRDTDAEILARELAIDRLLCEVAELRRRSEQHKAIIAPIQRVPPEIMAEIFLQLAAIEAEVEIDSRYDVGDYLVNKKPMVRPVRHRAPLIFGEISREWRFIMLSTPSLWNSISLSCTDEGVQTNISLCDLWLKRSGSLPLSIRLFRDWDISHPSQKVIENFQDVMKTILPYAQRWRILDLENLPVPSYDVLDGNL